MYLGIRIIKLSENVVKYPLDRLFRVMSDRIVCSKQEWKNACLPEEKYNSLKGEYSLTLTEVRLLKELIALNGVIVVVEESIDETAKQKLIE